MSFDTEVLARLPLASAALRVLNFVADPVFLAGLFAAHRGRAYERQIGFADLVQLLADALLLHGQSAHRTFQQARAAGALDASVKAAYDKIGRLPIAVSAALLTEGTARLRPLLPEELREPVPASLAAFTPLAFDGKKIKDVARRLRPVRGVRGQVIGGKLLVAEDVRTGLAVAMAASPDGETADQKLLPELVTRTRAVVPGPRLWVGDRLFCDLQLGQLTVAGDHWIVRYCAKTSFHPDREKPAQSGVNRRGQRYVEEWGWLGGPRDERRLYVRRITVERPEDEAIVVVTDLVDGLPYPAEDVLDMYLRRWGIEGLFQKVTEVFHLQALVSARENGTVFQAALCLLLYNVTVLVRAYVAQGANRSTEDVSLEKVFVDTCRQLTGLIEVLSTPVVIAHYTERHWTVPRLRHHLAGVLGATWRDWWAKSPPRKPSKKQPTRYLKGGHSSVYKIVRGLHETVPEPEPSARA